MKSTFAATGTVNLSLARWPHSKNTYVLWDQIRAHRVNIPWVLGFLYLFLPLATTGSPSQVCPVVSVHCSGRLLVSSTKGNSSSGLTPTPALHLPALDLLGVWIPLELRGEGQTEGACKGPGFE